MAGVTPVQKKDSMGQMGQMFQMGKTIYDVGKGSGEAPKVQNAPPPAVAPSAPDMSPQNNPGAIDRRIQKSGQDPNAFRGGY